MNANELMIGNYVYWNIPEKEWVPHKVVGILDNKIRTAPISIAENLYEYNPIPLSPEILDKCGFRATVENAGNMPCFKLNNYTIAWWGDKWQMWIKTVDLYRSPQYLHQLQNLLFALGKTLTIEL